MSSRALVLALVALLAAGATAFMVRNWVGNGRPQAAQAEAPAPKPVHEVLVAVQNLPAGMVIKAENLKWQAWPEAGLSEPYLVKGKGAMETYVGSVVRNGIGAGEPLTAARVVRPGERGFLAAILPPGMRAVAVPINATSGLSGLIFPGDRVDLILTHTIGGEDGEDRVRRASETVLQDIRVLATDARTDRESNDPALAKTATLEVTQKQAEKLAMVTELGKLSLSLRSIIPPEATADDAAADTGEAPTDAPKPAATAAAGGVKVKPTNTYTLDSQVSVLLDKPSDKNGKSGRELSVVRGKDATQVTF